MSRSIKLWFIRYEALLVVVNALSITVAVASLLLDGGSYVTPMVVVFVPLSVYGAFVVSDQDRAHYRLSLQLRERGE